MEEKPNKKIEDYESFANTRILNSCYSQIDSIMGINYKSINLFSFLFSKHVYLVKHNMLVCILAGK